MSLRCAAVLWTLSALLPAWALDTLSPEKLASGVYVLRGESGTPSAVNLGRVGNLGFLVGSSGVIVIDSGSSLARARELEAAIRRVTQKPIIALIITHPAQEFLFGNSWFKAEGVPIWSSPKTPKLMAERCDHCLETLESTVGQERMAGTQLVLPEGRHFDGRRLTLGGRQIKVFEGPTGTVPGNLIVLDEATGVAFVGALVSVHRIPGVQDTTPERWIEALAWLNRHDVRMLVPAFGAPARNQKVIHQDIDALKNYLEALEAKTRSLYGAQKKLAEVEDLSDLPAFKDWDNYQDNHPRNVFYRFLQLESEDLLSH